MKSKVSFKTFFSTLWRGIRKVICWVASMFGYNDNTTYGKLVRRVFAGSVAVVAFVLAAVMTYTGLSATINNIRGKTYNPSEFSKVQLSSGISYMDNYYAWEDSYLYNHNTGRKMLKGKLEWIVRSNDDDSLVVFSDGRKRGYINRFTGEIKIPAEYDHAWIFSDGVACVQKENVVFFIDHDNNPIFNQCFYPPIERSNGYVFHDGYCAVTAKSGSQQECYGLIDKNGDWVLDGPTYQYICRQGDYWLLRSQDGLEEVRTKDLTQVLGMQYTGIGFGNACIYATDNQGWRKKYNLDGKVIEDFVVSGVYALMYDTDEFDENGNIITKQSLCREYYIDDYEERCGLLSLDGKPLTPAIYTRIDAISYDLFICSISSDWNERVIIDGNGHKVGRGTPLSE